MTLSANDALSGIDAAASRIVFADPTDTELRAPSPRR